MLLVAVVYDVIREFLSYFTFEFDHFCFSVMSEVAWYVIHHGCI